MYSKLKSYINSLGNQVNQISDQRRQKLEDIADYVRSKDRAKLTFICTHNSRRSHFCQIWAATLSNYFDIAQVEAYSGGTEATAFNPRAVEAVKKGRF
jgi:methylaspartate ammonia-lyase